MHKYQIEKSLCYPPSLVTKIVLDIEQYPEFLPWIDGAKVMSKQSGQFIGEFKMSFQNFCTEYQSLVRYYKSSEEYVIKTEAVSGPFKTLSNRWLIKSAQQGAIVYFYVDFELKSRVLDRVAGLIICSVAEKVFGAFERRARKLFFGS